MTEALLNSEEISFTRFKPYTAYKDSGMEELGKIPANWEVKRVKWITATHKQGYYTEDTYVDEGVKLARITDIDDFGIVSFEKMPFVDISVKGESTFGLKDNDFLFARSGTIGRFGIVRNPERSVFASYLIRFRFKECLPEFLRFAFGSHFFKDRLISTLHGGANQNVHAENIKEQLLTIPPLDEELAIAEFLDRETSKIDALISKKGRLIELLKEKRTALISQAVTTGLDPNAPMKDSGVVWLGEIPAHWEVKRLKNIVRLNPEVLPETTDPDYLIQYIDITNVDEVSGVNPPDEMPFDNAPSRARRIVRPGDTILSTVRTYLKAVAYFENPPDNLIVSTGFAVLRPDIGTYPPYIFALIRCQPFIESVVSNSVGVAYPAISPSELAALPVWVPSTVEEQELIVEHLERETAKIDSLIVRIQEGIDRLKEYRTALISAAVTGKIDVRGETT